MKQETPIVLALDSPRWSTLEHAYGRASEDTSAPSGWSADAGFRNYSQIPNMIDCLRGIEAAPEPKAGRDYWDTLFFSALSSGNDLFGFVGRRAAHY
jgi:hypothetical protein